MAEFKSNLADACPYGREAPVAIAPSENVVVSVCFTAARFDNRDARQQAPVEVIIVGHMNEILRHILDGTVQPGHKLSQPKGPRIPNFSWCWDLRVSR